jgi:hypothetical protein
MDLRSVRLRVELEAASLFPNGRKGRSEVHRLYLGEDTLATIWTLPGASSVETIDKPGGGKQVRPSEPNGCMIDLVLTEEGLWSQRGTRPPEKFGGHVSP